MINVLFFFTGGALISFLRRQSEYLTPLLLFIALFLTTNVYLVFFTLVILLIVLLKNTTSREQALFFFLLAGIHGILFTKDFLELFLFFEWCLICSYFLLFYKSRKELFVLLKYFILSTIGSSLLLLGISMFSPTVFVLLVVFVGLAVKMGVAPFHMWVSEVYSTARLPVVIVFSAILSKVGALTLFKFYNFFTTGGFVLGTLAVLSMTLANISALVQKDVKKMLAYSSVAHLSIILLGFSFGSQQALTGSLFHIISHGFTIMLCFVCVFRLCNESGGSNIKELVGMGRLHPFLSAGLLVSFLSLSSVPGLALFVSEAMVLFGSNNGVFSALMILNLVLSSIYYIITLYYLLKSKKHKENIVLSFNEKVVIGLLIFCVVVFGLFPNGMILLTQSILPLFF